MECNAMSSLFECIVGLAILPFYVAAKTVQWGVSTLAGSSAGSTSRADYEYEDENYQRVQDLRDEIRNKDREQEIELKRLQDMQREIERIERERERKAAEERRKAQEREMQLHEIRSLTAALESYDFSVLEGRQEWQEVEEAKKQLRVIKGQKSDYGKQLGLLRSLEPVFKNLAKKNEARSQALEARKVEIASIRAAAGSFMEALKAVDDVAWSERQAHKEILESGELQRMKLYLQDIRCSLATSLDAQKTTEYYRERIKVLLAAEDAGKDINAEGERMIQAKWIRHDDFQSFQERLHEALLRKWQQEAMLQTIQDAIGAVGCSLVDSEIAEVTENAAVVYYDSDLGDEYKLAQVYKEGQLVLQLTRFMPRDMDVDEYKALIGEYERQKDEATARQWCSKLTSVINTLSGGPAGGGLDIRQRIEPEHGESHIMYVYDERYAPLVKQAGLRKSAPEHLAHKNPGGQ
jgi:hypothetical protein